MSCSSGAISPLAISVAERLSIYENGSSREIGGLGGKVAVYENGSSRDNGGLGEKVAGLREPDFLAISGEEMFGFRSMLEYKHMPRRRCSLLDARRLMLLNT